MATPTRFKAEGKYKAAQDKKANARPLIFAIVGDGSAAAGAAATVGARPGGVGGYWIWIRLVGDNNRVTQCFSPTAFVTGDMIFVRQADDRNLSYYEFAEFVTGAVPPVAPHNILSVSHADAGVNAASLGSIIKGVAGPLWNELVVGAARQILQVNAGATDFAWVSFDWDNFSADPGADMVHDHSAAGEGGQLDWDNIWSDAVHDHSSAAEGGQNLRQIQEHEFDDATILTIDGAGAVVRTQVYHIIAANAGVADDLDNATGGVEGDLLVIQPDAGDTITVRHNQGGAGDFWLAGGAHIVLNNQDHLALIHDGTSWCDVSGGLAPGHTILSATHTDSTPAGVQRGDIITGQGVGPTWDRVAIGPAGRFVKSDGTDVNWALYAAQTIMVGPGAYDDYNTLGGAVGLANILIAGGPPTAANPVVILITGIVTAEAGNVTIPSHCYVKGLGEESCIGMGANQLIFSSDSGAQDIRVTGNPGATTGLVYANNATNVILRNVRAVESTNLGYAFYFTGTSTVWCYDCVGEVTGTGASVFVSTSTSTWFRDCRAECSGSTGIGFNLGGTGNLFLKGCVADDSDFATGLNIGNTACTVETHDCLFGAATNDVQTGAASTWNDFRSQYNPGHSTIAGVYGPIPGGTASGESFAFRVRNNSGGAVAANDVGYTDENGQFLTTTTDHLDAAWCVVVYATPGNDGDGDADDDIWVANRGRVTIEMNENCAVGDFLVTSGVAGRAQRSVCTDGATGNTFGAMRPEVFAVARTANAAGAGGTCEALLLCHTRYVPATSATFIYRVDLSDQSDFRAQIAGVAGAVVTWNPVGMAGSGNTIDPTAANLLAKCRLYNETDVDYALIDDVNVGATQITLTAPAPVGWAVGEWITARSQTCAAPAPPPYFYDLDLSDADNTMIPELARGILCNAGKMDGGGSSYHTDHPWETYAGSREVNTYNPAANQWNAGRAPITLIQRRFCWRIGATGAGTSVQYLSLLGYWLATP